MVIVDHGSGTGGAYVQSVMELHNDAAHEYNWY